MPLVMLELLRGVVENGEWRPGSGDPTLAGWFTVEAYFVTAALCAMAIWRTFRAKIGGPRASHFYFWGGLALMLVLLGLNKQLDLQTWLWLVARQQARAEGWYEARRWIQIGFILGLTMGGAGMLAMFCWLSRHALRAHWGALLGAVFLLSFVVLRAASFHHVDVLLGWRLGGMPLNNWLELPGIFCIMLSALRHSLGRRPLSGLQ